MYSTGNLRDQKEKGLNKSRHRPPLSQEHIEQIYKNYFVPHWDNDPRCLQHKVYFDIAYFLGKRGKEGLRELKKNSFNLKTNSQDRQYLELSYNEATKKSQGDDCNEMNEQPIILSQPGNTRCPVASYKLYVSKLTVIDEFFQQPNPHFKIPTDNWYNKSPVGENTIGKLTDESNRNDTDQTLSVVPYEASVDNSNSNNNNQLTSNTNNTCNIMAMYRQNPVGLFMGANIQNCTININMPK